MRKQKDTESSPSQQFFTIKKLREENMSTTKDYNTSKKPQNSFCIDMDEMMKNFCSGSELISDCCKYFLRMCRSDTKGDSDFMAKCEQMDNTFFHRYKKTENK